MKCEKCYESGQLNKSMHQTTDKYKPIAINPNNYVMKSVSFLLISNVFQYNLQWGGGGAAALNQKQMRCAGYTQEGSK